MFLSAGLAVLFCGEVKASSWNEYRSSHFVLKYQSGIPFSWIQTTARKAEHYYDSIADRIGYARYGDFWTWENRAMIWIYESQEEYISMTGQPTWSQGIAVHGHVHFDRTRHIVSYYQHERFFETILPHEISHLILKDHIGWDKHVPDWFDEGVAQLSEENKVVLAKGIMKELIAKGLNYPMRNLVDLKFDRTADPRSVAIFYLQSVTVVHFLIESYGVHRFRRLCREMRDGSAFDEALRKSYPNSVNSVSNLETKWVRYFQ